MFCIFHLQVFDQNNEVYAPTPASRTFNEVTSKDLYWMLSLITTLSLILDRFTKLKVLVFVTATKMDADFCVCLAIFNSPRTNNYYSSLLNVLSGMRISISATL